MRPVSTFGVVLAFLAGPLLAETFSGKGVPEDEAKAEQLNRLPCDGGEARGCELLDQIGGAVAAACH